MRVDILDPADHRQILRRRRASGLDRFDEVWDGVYLLSPLADIEHQELATLLSAAMLRAIGGRAQGFVLAGTNLSDREERWKSNYRCPDFAVFLPGNPARNLGTHWLGGPDLAVEIISPHDRSRKKAGFYAKVATRELLLLDRKPWSLELYRLNDQRWDLAGISHLETSAVLTSAVLPITLRLLPGTPRPQIEFALTDQGQTLVL